VTASGESSRTAPGADRVVVLGKIAGSFGVHGWVRISSYTEPAENILEYEEWLIGGPGRWRPVEIQDGRLTGKGVLVKLAGIDTPEQARLQAGVEIGVKRIQMPTPEAGEYYWSDLEGLEAQTKEGQVLGRVDHFRTTPAGTVVVVRGEREHWIPFIKDRIIKVELDAGRIVFDWGLDW
jgi:16S rRNA processing protein RimM